MMQPTSLRTYMMYPEQIDPAHVLTMPELELSNALASTLVIFNESREIVSGLAEKWVAENSQLKFTLRPNMKWSNGDAIKAGEFKAALARAKELYGDELQALFNEVESIESPDDRTLVFNANSGASVHSILQKLTEPMYSLVDKKSDKTVNFDRSSGPYVLVSKSKNEIRLRANLNWYGHDSKMAQEVTLRPPPTNVNQVEAFVSDSWANLVVGSSIQRQSTRDEFKKAGFGIWERTLDKLFAIYPSKKFVSNGGAKFMQHLNAELKPEDFMTGLTGYTVADQFYPRGYILWERDRKNDPNVKTNEKLKTLRMIIPSSYKALNIQETLPVAIQKLTGVKVEAEYVPLAELESYMKKQDYDLLATGMAIADPNFEGAVSYFIERDPPFIPSSKETDLAKQVAEARAATKMEDRAKAMRTIMSEAQRAGHVAPIYHFSSFSVAKPEVDLSKVPSGDETILFAKVRVK